MPMVDCVRLYGSSQSIFNTVNSLSERFVR